MGERASTRAAEFFARYAFPRGTVGTSKNLFLFDPVQGRWFGDEPDPWVSPMATQIGPRRGPLSKSY